MIYVASRTHHADKWLEFRRQGYKINSSWIDKAGVDQTNNLSELWNRITEEIKAADALVLYVEPDDFPLKGALIEVGAALAFNKLVFVSAPNVELEINSMRPIGSWLLHSSVALFQSSESLRHCMEEAARVRTDLLSEKS